MSFVKIDLVRVLLVSLVVLFLSPPVGAAPVPDVCPSGCTYNSIQTAISIALPGTVIRVGNGAYTENIDFLGKAITVRSANGPANTTINGGGSGRVVTFDSGEGPDSVLSGFTITNGAGGIINHYSSPTITDCTISGNSAIQGGGIYNYNSSATITNCTIGGNSADYGGGFSNVESSPTITNCIISGNSASDLGGGFYIDDSSPTITNCTISGNSSSDLGGGIYNNYSSPTIANCTISGNSASVQGGGFYNDVQSSAITVNSILWGNDPDEVSLASHSSAAIIIEYTNIKGEWPGIGNINMDPLFVNSRSTSDAPTTAGDYHLKKDSPTIDSGTDDVSTYPIIPPDDIDGDARPQGAGFDMGSDEYVDSLWADASDLGGGWRWLDWFGYFNLNFAPWIYHMEHGFLFPFGTSTSSITFFDPAMGTFWWTSDTSYPNVYRFSDDEWLWYQKGSSNPRWFVRLSDGQWEQW